MPLKKSVNPDDPRVIIIRPGSIDPNKIPIINCLRLNFMFVNMQILTDDQTVVSGQIYIIDLDNVGMNHFTQMTPSLIRKMVMSRQVSCNDSTITIKFFVLQLYLKILECYAY